MDTLPQCQPAPLSRRRLRLLLAVLLCAVAFFVVTGGTALAAGIVVTSGGDTTANDGLCTLREAITAANTDSASGAAAGECAAGSGADTITFAVGLSGSTITLTNGELSLTSAVAIDANVPISVSGNNASRVFNISGSGVVTLTGLIIRDGSANYGGGISNFGSALTLKSSQIISNTASVSGGGISNSSSGSVTVDGSSIISNTATTSGGGVYTIGSGSVITFTNGSLIQGNAAAFGGGLWNEGTGRVAVNASSVLSNTATSSGGGIINISSGSLVTLTNSSLVQGNVAPNGGGIFNQTGSMTVDGSTIYSNTATARGGGIYNVTGGNVTVSASSVLSNTATTDGGGLYNTDSGSAITLINNSLVQGNQAANGGGIYNLAAGSVTVDASRIEANTVITDGGGIYNIGSGSVTVNASSVLSNTATNAGGGIFNLGNGSVITLTNNSLVQANNALVGTGGLANYSGTVYVVNSTIRANHAPLGGGLGNYAGGKATVNHTLVTENSSSWGGGLNNDGVGSVITVTNDSQIAANTAITSGGGIYNDTSGRVVIEQSRVISNSAGVNGGAIFNDNSATLQISASTVATNTATSNGGALYQAGGESSVTGSCIVNNSDTAVVHAGGTAPITATGNWWGSATGPFGAGPGIGDSVSSNVNFSGFLTSAILGCPARARPFHLTSHVPLTNAVGVAVSQNITASFDAGLNASTVTSRTFTVRSSFRGLFTDTATVSGNGLTLNPARDFFAGEQVQVVGTAAISSALGAALAPVQWGFTAGPVTARCFAGFTEVSAPFPAVDVGSVAWGDYDSDGDLDVLVAGSGDVPVTKLYRNDGPSTGSGWTFTEVSAGLTGVWRASVAWGDYDNDGDLDLLLTGQDGGGNRVAKLYRNDGGSSFTEVSAGLTGVNQGSVAWGDYDNDGDLDILITGEGAGFNRVTKLYRNDGGNTFSEVSAGLTGVNLGSVAWGDYDNDGDLDILLTGLDSGGNRLAKLYRNDGPSTGSEWTFTEVSAGLPGVYYFGSVAWGDYDNDGDLDILLTGDSASNKVARLYRNDGGNTFTEVSAGLTGVWFSSVAWGDYDNDGDLDFLLTGQDGGGNRVAKLYRNDGGNAFTEISAGLTGVQFSSVAWGDYDNDGDLDILLTGNDGSNKVAKLYRNDGCADVGIVKAVTPAFAAPGSALTYTLTFSNTGGPASGVVISDSVPVSVTVTGVVSSTYGSASIAQSSGGPLPSSGANFAWAVSNLAVGAGGVITLTGTLSNSADLLGTGFTNTATITASNDSTPTNNSSSATVSLPVLAVYPAQPGVLPGGSVNITVTLTPPLAGVAIRFTAPGGGGVDGTTNANGVGSVGWVSGGGVKIDTVYGSLVDSPSVTDTATIYAAAATSAGDIQRSASGDYSLGNLSPNFIQITKRGSGTPIVGWAEFAGNPCPTTNPGNRIVSPFVDAMVEDVRSVESLRVSLRYTDTLNAGQHIVRWCNNGVWQTVSAGLVVDAVSSTLVFTLTGATSPTLLQLNGTPFVGVGPVPTAVTLADFYAEAGTATGQPALVWETANESGLSGFHIWRGTAEQAETRLTDALIGAMGGLNGNRYTWQDSASFGWGERSYYWLEVVESDGSTFSGPVEVRGVGRLFLPTVGR